MPNVHKKALENMPFVFGLNPNDELVRVGPYKSLYDPFKKKKFIARCRLGCSCSCTGATAEQAIKGLKQYHKRFSDNFYRREHPDSDADSEPERASVTGASPVGTRVRRTVRATRSIAWLTGTYDAGLSLGGDLSPSSYGGLDITP